MKFELLSTDEVCRELRISRTTLWRLVRGGELPRPLRVSARRVAWRTSDVSNYLVRAAMARHGRRAA